MSVMRSILHGLREIGRGVDAASATGLGIPTAHRSAGKPGSRGSRAVRR